jgi:hypothetical protein
MKRPRIFIAGAWLLQVVAWFLPVVKEGVTFPQGLPGSQAFRVAACAVWPYEGWSIEGWYNAVLSTVSAVTTVLFLLGSIWIILRGSRRLRHASAWIAASAFVVNAHWCVRIGSNRIPGLRIGYFLWWLPFMLLALGLFDTADAAACPAFPADALLRGTCR